MTLTAEQFAGADQAHEAQALARELVTELAGHVGAPQAVREVLQSWHEELGPHDLALACVAAVRLTYAECLRVVEALPPGATAFTAPRKEHDQ